MKNSFLQKPVRAVFGILFTKDSKIILCQDKNKYPPKWKCFGGKIEEGEKIFSAFYREMCEETGLERENLPSLREKVIEIHKNDHAVQFITLRGVDMTNMNAGEEIKKLSAFSKKEIEELIAWGDILPCHTQAIKKVLEQ